MKKLIFSAAIAFALFSCNSAESDAQNQKDSLVNSVEQHTDSLQQQVQQSADSTKNVLEQKSDSLKSEIKNADTLKK